MLMIATVESNTKKSFNIGTKLIRAESAFEAIVEGTGCQFTYPQNDRDRRESNTTLKISETQANLITAMDLAYFAVSLELPIHSDINDSTSATVSTVFDVADVIWGTAYELDAANKSYLWIQEGAFKVRKFLVDYTLTEIVTKAETGAIT